jgi:hypothetical protein
MITEFMITFVLGVLAVVFSFLALSAYRTGILQQDQVLERLDASDADRQDFQREAFWKLQYLAAMSEPVCQTLNIDIADTPHVESYTRTGL